mgnify:CR=1 FL=1
MDKLSKYKSKRKKESPEPVGGGVNDKPVFVIQEHHASHLHWDLRLEMGGVLKSWAVPKEPPTETGIRRLAVQTEDHPLDYATFEGMIPKGHYGAGTVKIWDAGPVEYKSSSDDKIEFILKGKKMKGPYALIRFKKAGPRNWLFFRRN